MRCASKPAPLRISSRTPIAPASAGVTEGQRTRSRAMERASVMPPLNMRACRWASAVPNKFQFAQLVPIRGCTRAAIDRRLRQRLWAKSVGPSCPSQTQHFDKTPEAESDHDEHEEVRGVGIAKPVPHFAEQFRSNEERDEPPTSGR